MIAAPNLPAVTLARFRHYELTARAAFNFERDLGRFGVNVRAIHPRQIMPDYRGFAVRLGATVYEFRANV
jgi:hypothetical protein